MTVEGGAEARAGAAVGTGGCAAPDAGASGELGAPAASLLERRRAGSGSSGGGVSLEDPPQPIPNASHDSNARRRISGG
jgi:hypothetical protein